MNRQLKQVLVTGLMVMGLGMVAKQAQAISYDTMNVLVTAGGLTYGVKISSVTGGTGYNFGSAVALNTTTGSTAAIGVQNTGNVGEYFSLSVSTSDNSGSGGDKWVPSGAAGGQAMDIFEIHGYFNGASGVQPVDTVFNPANTFVGGAAPNPAAADYNQGSATLAGASQNLWLKLWMPTTEATADTTQHTIVLTINGQAN